MDDLESVNLLEGNPQEVFRAMAEHARFGTKSNLRPAIIYGGGGTCGADGLGNGMGFQRFGLSPGFRYVIGLSTGAHLASSHVTSQHERGIEGYGDVVANPEFLNIWRGVVGMTWGSLMAHIMRKQTLFRPIVDIEKPIRFYAGTDTIQSPRGPFKRTWAREQQKLILQITDVETGSPVFIEPDEATILDAIHASSALPPPLYKFIAWHERLAADGGMADPLPIQRTIEYLQERPTHIMFIANRPRPEPVKAQSIRRLALKFFSHNWPVPLRNAFFKKEEVFAENLSFLRQCGIPFVIVWTDGTLGVFDTDREKIRTVIQRTYVRTLATLRRYLPQEPGATRTAALPELFNSPAPYFPD